jgi:hypothetical protein
MRNIDRIADALTQVFAGIRLFEGVGAIRDHFKSPPHRLPGYGVFGVLSLRYAQVMVS